MFVWLWPPAVGLLGGVATSLSQLNVALHATLDRCAQPTATSHSAGRPWLDTATLLRDAVCDLAAESAAGGGDHDGGLQHEAASSLCASLLERCREAQPELYAVAKLSAKRNGNLEASRWGPPHLGSPGLR